MTSKPLRLSLRDLQNTPLGKLGIGFDRTFEDMFDAAGACLTGNGGYPPYNIAKLTDDLGSSTYEITLAVAGFKDDDIEIVVENNHLRVVGNSNALSQKEDVSVEYLHKGIAERNFTRTFTLAEHVEVREALLRDGILKIRLVRTVPEELQPLKIEIKS